MLVYSTKFKVNDSLNIETFINLIHKWVTSEKSHYDFPDFKWSREEEFIINSNNNKTTLAIYVLIEQDTVAAKLSSIDDSEVVWENYYSLVKNEMYVELQKHNQDPNSFLTDSYHLPHMIRLLYEGNYIELISNNKLISGKIYYLSSEKKDSIKLAQEIIQNQSHFDKPIVYVSYYNYGNRFDYILNIDVLEKQLLGLAYIVVEENSDFSYKICELTDYKNPYNGAVQIYYPNGNTKRYLPNLLINTKEYKLRNEIVKDVFNRILQVKIDTKFTISYITNEIYKIRIHNLKKSQDDSKSLKNELELCHQRIKDLEKNISDLNTDIYSYKSKCYYLQEAIDANIADILSRGQLTDLYENEIFDCIYDTLKNAILSCNQKSRQYEILKSILETNEIKYTNSRNSKIDKFKKIIRNSKETGKKFKQDLINLGLTIEGDNHIKAKFPNGKQFITLSSTPSDNRDPDNAIKDFKKLF